MRNARTSARIARALVAGLLFGSLVVAGGCRSGGGAAAPAEGGAAPAERAAPPKGVAPPADHPMAKIERGMTTRQVEDILGAPDNEKNYITGKAFNPFNYGSDSGSRLEYAYKGQGRIIFAIKKFTGRPAVERIDYDPAETGD